MTSGSRRSLTRGAGLVAAALAVGLTLVSVPLRFEQLQSVCAAAPCAPGQLLPDGARALEQQGLAVRSYAAYTAALDLAAVATYFVVAVVLLWRKGSERIAVIVGLFFLGLALDTFPLPTLAATWPAWGRAVTLNYSVSIAVGVVLFAAVFPDGRFVPGWTRWMVLLAAVTEVPRVLALDSPLNPDRWGPDLQALNLLVWVAAALVAQVWRYRRVSGPVQRLQTRWVLLGFAGVLGANLVAAFVPLLVPAVGQQGSLPALALTTLVDLSLLLTPLAVGVAILRHRLFDIDRLLNRTLVYGLLTTLLAGVYAAGVFVAGQVLNRGEQSELAVAASTLAVAALFQPLRRRVQAGVDRRFNRRRYDAARSVEAFSARLRDEIDLDSLAVELPRVVRATMQPSRVSLWVRS